jgi:hypothetical protein
MQYYLTPLDYVVLIGNIVRCEDANLGAERTKAELIAALNTNNWKPLREGLFEEALYCCNMNYERGEFYHPLDLKFKTFLQKVIPEKVVFHTFWNVLVKDKNGKKEKESVLGLGDHPSGTHGYISGTKTDLSKP